MSMLEQYLGDEGFEIPDEEETQEYSLMETGWYTAEISDVEIKETASGSGVRFIVEFTIFGEKYDNRKVWNENGFNFLNSNPTAQAIGQQELGNLLKACGYGENERLRDEVEIVGKQLEIYIVTKAGKGEYKDRNITKKYRRLGEKTEEKKENVTPSENKKPETKKRVWER